MNNTLAIMDSTTTTTNIDQKPIENFINLIIHNHSLDECFSGFTKTSPQNDLTTKKIMQSKLISIFKDIIIEPNLLELNLKFYIDNLSRTIDHKQSDLMFEFLDGIINADLVKPMIVCRCILSENFELNNEIYWVNGLNFIEHIIHLVKYKEVRDILAILLSKISLIPIKCSKSIYRQVHAFHNLIALILDRDTSLLPAYLVLDEIQNKFYTVLQNGNGHWAFSKLISVFVDSFRPIAKIVSHSGRPRIMPIVGYCFWINSLNLDEKTAKYKLKGLLPYDKELNEPQTKLLLQIIEQNNSRETIAHILSLAKHQTDLIIKDQQRSINIIEKLLIELIISTVVKSCNYKTFFDNNSNGSFESFDFNQMENDVVQISMLWNHIASTTLYFISQYQNISFPLLIAGLLDRLYEYGKSFSNQNLIKCREFLMWTLLQIISGTKSSSTDDQNEQNIIILTNFLKLFDLLYWEKEPLPLPDFHKRNSVFIMSASSLFILITKNDCLDSLKQQPTQPQQPRIPIALKSHINYLRMAVATNSNLSKDYSIAILCNSYSSNPELYSKIYRYFVDNIIESRNNNNKINQTSTTTTSSVNDDHFILMEMLDSLTIHTRKELTSYIMNRLFSVMQAKTMPTFPSYLIETYCLLTSISEIDQHEETKTWSHLIQISKIHSWNYLFSLLEIYSYRLHRINSANQMQLLRQLFNKSIVSQINHIQLYSFMENTALKILYGFNCFEFIAFCTVRPKIVDETFLPSDSEELYKIFIYTLARATHITGTEALSSEQYVHWVKEILKEIKNLNNNLAWPSFTLQCFPPIISEFYQTNTKKETNHQQLKTSVDEEYRRWKSITNDNDRIKHFTSQGTPPLIYCLLYKMLLDNENIPQVSYKILDKIGVKALSNHLRTFADFLVLEFANLVGGSHVSKSKEAVNDLIWKCHVVTLDKLLLCLALRSFEGNEAQVCFFIIQLLTVKNPDVKNRVNDFVKENSPEHWKQKNWNEMQQNFLKKYPEKYYFDHLQDVNNLGNAMNIPPIFSNICLRILPVFDIIIHRLIEMLSCGNDFVSNFVDTLLNEYGCLYKFHSYPITFLYNTLHYYEINLKEKTKLKKKLVFTIINAFKDFRPKNWSISEPFMNYCQKNNDEEWNPGSEYFKFLVGRFVDTLSSQSKCPFSMTDYRFNEFSNIQSHALYVTCVEILALPGKPSDISNQLINVVTNSHKNISRQDIELWINAIGLIFTALPESYSSILKERFVELLKNSRTFVGKNFFHIFDFKNSHSNFYENDMCYTLALLHSYWFHGTFGQLCLMPQFIKEKIKPIVQTEEQLILVCYFVGPFLQRLQSERTKCIIAIAHELYQMLDTVDKKCSNLYHIDTICDLFYHFKYRFTGNLLQKYIDERIDKLRPELQQKLRFLSQISDDSVSG
uniref:Mediator of RNA polymerase II transcription subunit 23 n=1 Tax=Dermatophagoides pteronyssinus TaxID=6956 RepID=A0A6P6Y4C7_DERPT|nr:mediator of RNA polymerase II transcription subunit 23-like [Dermatophagoides pteronyssinus]